LVRDLVREISNRRERWLADYLSVPVRLGIAPRNQERLAVSGAQHGASLAGFAERVQQSAEYVNANQGNFSQRFAAMLSGMGIRGT
jgi:hypothetical protein